MKNRIIHIALLAGLCLTLWGCSYQTSQSEDSSQAAETTSYEESTSDASETAKANTSEEQADSTADAKDDPQTEESSSRDVFAMDTYMTLSAYGSNREAALDAGVAEIERLDALLSTGSEDSEIGILNKEKTASLSEDTTVLLERALEISQDTKGAFDVAVYPLMKIWGFTDENYKVPTDDEITETLKKTDYASLTVDASNHTATLSGDAEVDLGGIAKGYTSQRVGEIFQENGVTSGVISLGGNVQAIGTKPDGSRWRVGIQPPTDDMDYVGLYLAADESVITSGGYERYFEKDGVTYHHILDAKTGYPAESGLISVTIISQDGALADAMSTASFVMGKESAIEYWRAHSDEYQMILVNESEEIFITEGIEENFSSDYEFSVISES